MCATDSDGDKSPATCYRVLCCVYPPRRAVDVSNIEDLKIAIIITAHWKFFRMEIMFPWGCCILKFSRGYQARICSLMEMLPAEEWRSAGANLLVRELLAAFSLSATRRYNHYSSTDCTNLVCKYNTSSCSVATLWREEQVSPLYGDVLLMLFVTCFSWVRL